MKHIADTQVRTRINAQTKANAVEALDSLGITLSEAVRLLLEHVAKERSLPFKNNTSK